MRKSSIFILLVMLSLFWAIASAQADFDLETHYIDYEITLCVGDSVTLYKMPYSNDGDHFTYDENGRPGRFVSATGEPGAVGLNAFDDAYSFDDIRYGGQYGSSLNYYRCNITLTVTGKMAGSGIIYFTDTQVAVGKTGATLQVPRVTVHVVDSGSTYVSAKPQPSWLNGVSTYASPPSAVRPNWTFDGWQTTGNYMYAKWKPNFFITGNIPGGSIIDNLDDGATLTVNQAIIPRNSDSLHHDGFTIGFWLTNYYFMNNAVDGEPVWTVTKLDNLDVPYVLQDLGQNSWVFRTDYGTPQERCSIRFKFTCAWGGVSKSVTVKINYVPVSMPVGTDIPDVIDLQVGQTTDYTFHFANNYSFENRIWYTGSVNGDWQAFANLLDWSNDGNTIHLSPKVTEPGFYAGILTIVDGNVAMNKEVVFRIADRNGNIPALELNLFYESDIAMAIFNDNDETGLHHQNFVTDVGIPWDIYSVIADAVEGEPVWTHWIEQEIEDEIIYHVQDFSDQYQTGIQIFIDQYPAQAREADIHVTCSWGEYESEAVVHVEFTTVSSLPGGMLLNWQNDLTDLYTTVGEDCQITVSWDPAGYAFSDRTWLDIDIYCDVNVWWDWIDGNRVQHIQSYEAGTHYVEISLNNGNLRMTRGFKLHVADENGNVPGPAPWFAYENDCYEVDFMLGALGSSYASGWATVPHVFGWTLDNLDELRNAYGYNPDVEWTYEYISGPEAGLNLVPRNYMGIDGDSCSVYLSSMPENPGSLRFNLICSWDGHVGSLPVQINFVERSNNLASDTSLPTKLTLPVGESIRMMGFYTEDGDYDVPADDVIMDYPWNDLFEIDWEDPVTFTLTGLKAGSVTGMTGVGGYANAYFHRRMTINVVDTVITLPDGLKTIESEAFAGIDDVVMYIPSSVTWIEDDAIEPHVTVICPEDSYAFSRCNAMGLYVIGK